MRPRKVLGWLLLVPAALVLGLWLLNEAVIHLGSEWARRRIESRVRGENCPGCELKIGKLRIDPLAGRVTARDVSFHSDARQATEVRARAQEIELRGGLLHALFGPARRIDFVAAQGLDFTLREDSRKPPSGPPRTHPPENSEAFRKLPPLSIGGVRVREGVFHYVHEQKAGWERSSLDVTDVELDVAEFGTRPELSPRYLDARATASPAGSGRAHLQLRLDLFSPVNHDDLSIDLRGTNLAALEPFFSREERLQLKGYLARGTARLHLSRGMLTGDFHAKYRGLDLTFRKRADRGEIPTLLANVGSTIALKSEGDGTAPVNARRKGAQSVFKWLITGLKDAAVTVMKGEGRKPGVKQPGEEIDGTQVAGKAPPKLEDPRRVPHR